MSRLLRLYSNRIVNVNVNVILAGFLALVPTIAVVHLSRHFGVRDEDTITITIITFVADVIADISIYFGLHWLANHSPGLRRLKQVDDAYRQMSFVRDAVTVQVQRFLLSPLLYGIAFGTIYFLLHAGFPREVASGAGLMTGILSTRVLHTVWMIRWEQRVLTRLGLMKPEGSTGVVGAATSDGVSPSSPALDEDRGRIGTPESSAVSASAEPAAPTTSSASASGVDAGPDESGSKVTASPSGAASSSAESPPIPGARPLVNIANAPR